MNKKLIGIGILLVLAFTLAACDEVSDAPENYDVDIVSDVETFEYDLEVDANGEMTLAIEAYDDAFAFSHWKNVDGEIVSEDETFTLDVEEGSHVFEAVFTDSEGDADNGDDEQNDEDDEQKDEETGDDNDETDQEEEPAEPEAVYHTGFESPDVSIYSDGDVTFNAVDWAYTDAGNTVYENQDRFVGDASMRLGEGGSIETLDGFESVHSVSFKASYFMSNTEAAFRLSLSSGGQGWTVIDEQGLTDTLKTYEYTLDFTTIDGLSFEDATHFRIEALDERINIDDFTIYGSETAAVIPDDPDDSEDDDSDDATGGGEDPIDGNLADLLDADLMDYYNSAEGLYGDDLESELRNIIDSDVNTLSYSQAWDVLQESDEDPDNPDNVILVYTRDSVNGPATYPTWNREHVWPQSKLESSGAKTDVHHLKPADVDENSTRGNLPFGESGSTYEPVDEVKGDIARMVFYMDARYPSLNITESTIGDLGTLLEWHEMDPVDDFEENRNDVLYDYQNNRNPFIDHPHLVWLMYHDHPAVDLD